MREPTSAPQAAGTHMRQEMHQQPAVLTDLVARADTVTHALRTLLPNGPAGVVFLGRGSSDHAALLGRYAVEEHSGLPVCLAAPSITTAYHRTPDAYAGWLLVALSQSGRTPEIVNLARQYAAAGARVVAVTNDRDSELAATADVVAALDAGPERAVPATKTVTGQMLAVLTVASGLTGADAASADSAPVGAGRPGVGLRAGRVRLSGIPDMVAAVLADPQPVRRAATELAAFDRLVVVGRGGCYPAALETALKLQESTGVLAHGFSTADFRHGPIAVCGPDCPAVLVAGDGPADADTLALRDQLRARGALVVTVGRAPDADLPWPAPLTADGLAHLGDCLPATVRGQQLAWELAAARGVDPDAPSGLHKVTLTH